MFGCETKSRVTLPSSAKLDFKMRPQTEMHSRHEFPQRSLNVETEEELREKVRALQNRLHAALECTKDNTAEGNRAAKERAELLRHVRNLDNALNLALQDKSSSDLRLAAALLEMDRYRCSMEVEVPELGSFNPGFCGLPVPEELFYMFSHAGPQTYGAAPPARYPIVADVTEEEEESGEARRGGTLGGGNVQSSKGQNESATSRVARSSRTESGHTSNNYGGHGSSAQDSQRSQRRQGGKPITVERDFSSYEDATDGLETSHYKAPAFSSVIRHEFDLGEMQGTSKRKFIGGQPVPLQPLRPFQEHHHSKKTTIEREDISGKNARRGRRNRSKASHASQSPKVSSPRSSQPTRPGSRDVFVKESESQWSPQLDNVQREAQLMELQCVEHKYKRTDEKIRRNRSHSSRRRRHAARKTTENLRRRRQPNKRDDDATSSDSGRSRSSRSSSSSWSSSDVSSIWTDSTDGENGDLAKEIRELRAENARLRREATSDRDKPKGAPTTVPPKAIPRQGPHQAPASQSSAVFSARVAPSQDQGARLATGDTGKPKGAPTVVPSTSVPFQAPPQTAVSRSPVPPSAQIAPGMNQRARESPNDTSMPKSQPLVSRNLATVSAQDTPGQNRWPVETTSDMGVPKGPPSTVAPTPMPQQPLRQTLASATAMPQQAPSQTLTSRSAAPGSGQFAPNPSGWPPETLNDKGTLKGLPTTVAPTSVSPRTTVPPTTIPPRTITQPTAMPPTTTAQPTAMPPTTMPPRTTVQPTNMPPGAAALPRAMLPGTAAQPTAMPPTTMPPRTTVQPTNMPPGAAAQPRAMLPGTAAQPTAMPQRTAVQPTFMPPTTVQSTTMPPTTMPQQSPSQPLTFRTAAPLSGQAVAGQSRWPESRLKEAHVTRPTTTIAPRTMPSTTTPPRPMPQQAPLQTPASHNSAPFYAQVMPAPSRGPQSVSSTGIGSFWQSGTKNPLQHTFLVNLKGRPN